MLDVEKVNYHVMISHNFQLRAKLKYGRLYVYCTMWNLQISDISIFSESFKKRSDPEK